MCEWTVIGLVLWLAPSAVLVALIVRREVVDHRAERHG